MFRAEQNRVLVADEVGLGKTLVAKGVIAKLAKSYLENGKKALKVVYVCSNQAIAKQNVKTLNVLDTELQIDDARLSMQHLNVMRSKYNSDIQKQFFQLIPFTPGTSFEIDGGGDVNERALIYAVLCKKFGKRQKALSKLLKLSCNDKNWKSSVERKQQELANVVEFCKENGKKGCKKKYPLDIIAKLAKETINVGDANNSKNLYSVIESVVKIIEREKCYKRNCSKCKQNKQCCRGKIVQSLRNAFAKIGVSMLKPDLVIMDEFQRFNKLIRDTNDVASDLAKHFLKEYDGNRVRTRVLLLSATPYKLYSTIDELYTNSKENPYEEFFFVINFLFPRQKEEFKEKWDEYSKALKASVNSNWVELEKQKNTIENYLYKGICRTERISVLDGEKNVNVIGLEENEVLSVSEDDIRSYIQAQSLINDCACGRNVPIDYIKSCPFLMSFMENYVLKKDIVASLKENGNVKLADRSLLWLSKERVEDYKELPKANARLEWLKDFAFQNKSEQLLWCPPSRPYYPLSGVFAGIDNFTKTLVFSSWEMVPKMISTLISYEAERRVCRSGSNYFVNKSTDPLRYDIKKNGNQLFSEIYPSKKLSQIYNPIEYLDKPIKYIKARIKETLRPLLKSLKGYESSGNSRDWYIASIILLDEKKYVQQWIDDLKSSIDKKNTESNKKEEGGSEEASAKEKKQHDKQLRGLIDHVENILNENTRLGKQPKDLLDYLVKVTMASFSTCFYRSFGETTDLMKATEFGRVFVNNFNNPEAEAVLRSIQNESKNYLNRVFDYCINGCFQGMLDEYVHLINKGNTQSSQDEVVKNLDMLRAAQYTIDTFAALKGAKKKSKGKKDLYLMRSHFATCFSKSAENAKGNRKENLRNAFNSPLRPFVLATTSIGQEGLDFHNYCRRIMHWNLPSNPVELEQREGRIDRYKCLAIRQNVASHYGYENGKNKFEKNNSLWNQMFERAKQKKNGGRFSELIPFWVFGKKQTIKMERLVPIYPFSSDVNRYERLIKILSLYRLTMGQDNQEDLLEYIFSKCDDKKINQLKKMFIDLSPYSRKMKGKA